MSFSNMSHWSRCRDFRARYPQYRETHSLDRLRRDDYSRLDRLGHAYLDYTGGSLYSSSQLRRHQEFLEQRVLGNPHSRNPTSIESEEWADRARSDVLSFLRASEREYEVIFTSNASNAIRLVAESYPFDTASCYLMTADNHNSINGVREFAARAGSRVEYARVVPGELRIDERDLADKLSSAHDCAHKLFAFPAQSNYTGVRHAASWVDRAKRLGWDVLWDCAAFAPTNRVDLSVVKADFVPLSFYKLFGYPTGIGALVARREALSLLKRPWFSGGTILVVSVQNGWFHRAPGHMAFEDGTIDYSSLPGVSIGLDHLLGADPELIHARTEILTSWLLEEVSEIRHANGRRMVRVHGPTDMVERGATISFDLTDDRGMIYDIDRVEELAGERLISLRTGCFCNPGAREASHALTEAELSSCFRGAQVVTPDECNRRILYTSGKYPSGIRVSLGIASNIEDCLRFIDFLADLRDVPASQLGGVLYSRELVGV